MAMKAMRVSSASPRSRQRQRNQDGAFVWGMLTGLAVGVGGMFILDPQSGRRRRALARDQIVHFGHVMDDLVSVGIPRRIDYLSGFAEGVRHRTMARLGRTEEIFPDDDQFITDRVRSIVFRDPQIPKGEINLNTVDRVVYLRGHVDDERMVREIEARVRRVEGVRDVVNVINRPDLDPSVVRASEQHQQS